MTELVCPKCGRKSGDIEFIEAFCADCYPAKIKLPKKLEIEQCKACEKVRIRGEWMPYSKKAVAEHVAGKCRGEFDSVEYDMDEANLIFTVKGKKKVVLAANVEIKTVMCAYCSRMSGGYYEGLIQLRGNPKKINKYADIFFKKLSKKTFIAKEEEKHGGLDIYVGSSKAVVNLLPELKVDALITKKLVGRREGKRLYRTTFLLRL